jgi:hypothetical protein
MTLMIGVLCKVNTDTPRFTLIFDREAYEPAFFAQLWEDHRVAVITYRKNVTGLWEEECFADTEVSMIYQTVTMRIYEKEVVLSWRSFREIRRLSENGHQTSIITNNKILEAMFYIRYDLKVNS